MTSYNHRVRKMNKNGLFLLAIVLILSGCGFHLRGSSDVALGVSSVYIETQGASSLKAEVARQLQNAGVAVSTRPVDAGLRLMLSDEQYDRRVLSVDPNTGKVREYEVGLKAKVSARDTRGNDVLKDQEVSQIRDFIFDENAVLGTYQEEAVLRKELTRDTAAQVLRLLQAANAR